MDDLKTGRGPSEAIFRRLVEEVRDYAIFLLDPDGRVASWNAGAEAIKGYRAEEILGRHFSVFYPPEAVESGWPEIELATARAERRFEDEGWRVRKDGSRFWANVVITALHDDGGGLLGFAKITRDMTERRRVESLEESGRRVSEFLAVLAHELRNPLAPIRNAVAVLRASGGDARGTEWARDVIDRQVNYLTRLVDDLLDVSRITRGKITLRPETVPVGEIASAAVEAVRPLVEERKQELRVSVPDETVRVRGDRIRLVQILVNLLHNAAKYTPERGWIRLALERRGEEAVFTVRDHFKVASLDGFGLKDRTAAIGAAGGALHYLAQNLRRDVKHLTRLSFYQRTDFLALDYTTLRHLEILEPQHRDAPRNACLYGALNKTVTPMGARLLRNWLSQPLATVEPIRQRQETVATFIENAPGLDTFRAQLGNVRDLERTLGRLSTGSGNARDLVVLRQALEQIPALKQTLLQLVGTSSTSSQSSALIGNAVERVPTLLQNLTAQLSESPDLVELISRSTLNFTVSASNDSPF